MTTRPPRRLTLPHLPARGDTLGPLAARAGLVVAGVVAVALVPGGAGAGWLLLAVGLTLTLLRTQLLGGIPAVVGCLAPWILGPGRDAGVGPVRAVLFALSVLAVHQTAALAMLAPSGTRVSRAAAVAWLRSAVPGAAAAAVAGLVLALLGRADGSSTLDALGLVAAILTLVVLVWAVRRSSP